MWPNILLLLKWQDWGVFVLLLYVTDYFNQNIAFFSVLLKSAIKFNSNVIIFMNVWMIWVTSKQNKTKQQRHIVYLNKPENRKEALVGVLQSSPPSCGLPQQMVSVYLLLFQAARTKQGGVPFSTINTVIERFLNMLTMTNSCLNLFCSLGAL